MDKRGTSIVEAAMVMPMVIAAVLIVVLIMSFMIREAGCETKLHQAAVYAMGVETKTQLREEKAGLDVSVNTGWRGSRKCRAASQDMVFSYRIILSDKTGGTKKSGVYEVNEKKYIRNVDLLRMGEKAGNE